MIKVTLRDGRAVSVPKGKVGYWNRQTATYTETTPTEVGMTLDIKEKEGYGVKVLASFKAEEVIGYTVEEEPEET